MNCLRVHAQIKNQVNNGLNSKLQKVKDHFKMQRKVLEDRKKEIEKLRGWDGESRDLNQRTGTRMPERETAKTPISTKSAFIFPPAISTSADAATLMPTPSNKRSTPSSSRKRHASIIEAKSRQLVEEEGHAFRQQQTRQHSLQRIAGKGAWSEGVGDSPVLPLSTRANVLSVPMPDTKWYEGGSMSSGGAASGGSPAKGKGRGRRVHFDAEAIILNAALEGELDLLKECIQKVKNVNKEPCLL